MSPSLCSLSWLIAPFILQDAYILSTVLGHPLTTRETITRALGIYDHIRRPFSQAVQERARLNGQYFTFSCRGIDFDNVPEIELLPTLRDLGQTFTKNWEWAWTTSMGPSIGEAMRLLESWREVFLLLFCWNLDIPRVPVLVPYQLLVRAWGNPVYIPNCLELESTTLALRISMGNPMLAHSMSVL